MFTKISYLFTGFFMVSFLAIKPMQKELSVSSLDEQKAVALNMSKNRQEKTDVALIKLAMNPLITYKINNRVKSLTAQKKMRHLFHQSFRSMTSKDDLPETLKLYKKLSMTKQQEAIDKKNHMIQLGKSAHEHFMRPEKSRNQEKHTQTTGRPIPNIDLAILNEKLSQKKKLPTPDYLNIKKKHHQAKKKKLA